VKYGNKKLQNLLKKKITSTVQISALSIGKGQVGEEEQDLWSKESPQFIFKANGAYW